MSARKPVEWIGSARSDLRKFPQDVRRVMGQAIDDAQLGTEHPAAKALKGFGGCPQVAIVEDFVGETFLAGYLVRFYGAEDVLHAFQKKSKKGIATPRHEVDLIRARLKRAEEHYRTNYPKGAKP